MDRLKYLLKRLPKPLKNKYVVTVILFSLWILFVDDYNLINQNKIQNNVNELKKQKEFYIEEIKNDSIKLYKLRNDTHEQEKFARERFLMKKNNEDVFIIRRKEDE